VHALLQLMYLLLLMLPAASLAAERVFSPEDILQWNHHSFTGNTRYTLVELDGEPAIHAICEAGTASGLFLEQPIDLEQTPVIEWRWRVDNPYADIDERARSGDDFPARLYAVDRHRVFVWRTRAINYVWASVMPKGADWPNAYQSQAHMIAMRSGEPETEGGWFVERRNLREDFSHFHNRHLTEINALAIMTDCDDTGQQSEAWYGSIRLLPE